MYRIVQFGIARLTIAAVVAVCLCGCTSLDEYLQNGYKVGPDYCPPSAMVAERWIDEIDQRPHDEAVDHTDWWTIFKDPKLTELVHEAHQQNLNLQQASYRVLESRLQLAIARGDLFPQQQTAAGSYRHSAFGGGSPSSPTYSDQWAYNFTLGWELDLWGRLRRAVAAADADLAASVESYDDVLVTLIGDVATAYVQIRTDDERLRFLKENIKLQTDVYEKYAKPRRKAGFKTTDLDVAQIKATLKQAEASIPQLESDRRLAGNRLCLLLGIPPEDLAKRLGEGAVPQAGLDPSDLGIPADLLRRRPDVRRAERLAAAQGEMIGFAQADLYPQFTLGGSLGYQAPDFGKLFSSHAFSGNIGPAFQWKLLNYGRVVNGVRVQDARFQELVVAYQQAVLQANQEVENGLSVFLHAQERFEALKESVAAGTEAEAIARDRYTKGLDDLSRYTLIAQNLIQQQDLLAQTEGQIALGLIQVYRALGGGWQIRLGGSEAVGFVADGAPADAAGPNGIRELIPVPPAEESAEDKQPLKDKPDATEPE